MLQKKMVRKKKKSKKKKKTVLEEFKPTCSKLILVYPKAYRTCISEQQHSKCMQDHFF